MWRNGEYSKELKLEIVNRYKSGAFSTELANEYDMARCMIYEWHNKFETMWEAAFEHTHKNKRYSKELKIAAIKEYMNGKGSLEQITNK